MSDYIKEKVLRVPISKGILDELNIKEIRDLEDLFPELVDYAKVNKFQISPTETEFLDYVLKENYGADCDDYGKVRLLTNSEKEKYEPIFHQISKSINMDDVHLVEFCWYNCCEAPDYYELEDDDFNKEI